MCPATGTATDTNSSDELKLKTGLVEGGFQTTSSIGPGCTTFSHLKGLILSSGTDPIILSGEFPQENY